jgi:molybdopterin converting factor small subunit
LGFADDLMDIDVLLFAAARESAGRDSIRIQLPENAVASDVMEAIEQVLPELAGLIPSCRLAVDCEYVGTQQEIPAHSELALIPPVSGG